MGELYKLTFPNGKQYIGISVNGARARFLAHCSASSRYKHIVYAAWRKHGKPKLTVLAVIENSMLNELERRAIASYGTFAPGGYNITAGGGGISGFVHSTDTKDKISASQKGISRKNHTAETKAMMSASHKGKQFTPEHIEKMRINARSRVHGPMFSPGKVFSPEYRANLSAALRGNTNSTGKVFTPERRARISFALTGKVMKQATKDKLSEARAGKSLSAEHRAKIGAGSRNAWKIRKDRFTQQERLCL